MAFQIKDEDTEELADINVVPLVDVMLVLLIIFMVAAPLSIGGINIALPTSKAKTVSVDEDRVVLSVTKTGEFYIDKLRIESPKLQQKLRAIYEFRKKKSLYIRADRGVQYGAVVDAMSAAKLAGVGKISMLTKTK